MSLLDFQMNELPEDISIVDPIFKFLNDLCYYGNKNKKKVI